MSPFFDDDLGNQGLMAAKPGYNETMPPRLPAIIFSMVLTLNMGKVLADPTPNNQPSSSTLSAADVKRIADSIRPLLPTGWTMKNHDDQIELTRTEAIQVYNGVALPYAPNDSELKEYVKPNVMTETYKITLRLTDRMTEDEFRRIGGDNSRAEQQARTAINERKLPKTSVAKFLDGHPELGYRELPACYTESFSIYLTTSLNSYLRFYTDEVGKECNGLLERVGGMFQHYGSKPEHQNTLSELQGAWRIDSSTGDKQDVFTRLVGQEVSISGEVMRLPALYQDKTVKLGPTADPREIDLIQNPHAKGWSRHGIFRLEGDTLTLSLTSTNEPRPTDFDNHWGRNVVVDLIRIRKP